MEAASLEDGKGTALTLMSSGNAFCCNYQRT